jgi:hypothetical protein
MPQVVKSPLRGSQRTESREDQRSKPDQLIIPKELDYGDVERDSGTNNVNCKAVLYSKPETGVAGYTELVTGKQLGVKPKKRFASEDSQDSLKSEVELNRLLPFKLLSSNHTNVGDDDDDGKRKPIKDKVITFTRHPKWPHNEPNLHPKLMAGAGFCFTGKGDCVHCDYCGVNLDNWNGTMNPLERHLRERPHCPISYEEYLSNVPASYPQSSVYGQTIHNRNFRVHPGQPDYQNYEARLETFRNYSPSLPLSKQDLAAAGFIFQKEPDFTECFACNMVLKGWEEGDNPMDEHRKLAPGCPFVQTVDRAEIALPYEFPMLPSQRQGHGLLSVDTNEPKFTLTDSDDLGLESPLTALSFHEPGKVDSRDEHLRSYEQATVPGDYLKAQRKHDFGKTSSDSYTYPKTYDDEFSTNGDVQAKNSIQFLEKTDKLSPQDSDSFELAQAPIRYPPTKLSKEDSDQDLLAPHRFNPAPSKPNAGGYSLSQFSDMPANPESDLKLCKICMDRDIDAIFLPCGHVYCCSSCAEVVSKCPFCRKPVEHITKAYLPF